MEKQELYCHGCGNYVRFEVDLEWHGRFVLNCPKCDHEHCRIINKGVITDERWDSRNGGMQTYAIANVTYSVTSYDSTTSASSNFTADMWLSITTA